ncbi:AraC family transcriptional regulator [Amycolatopsis saalfeldensis]|uniref:AraC-type DNA-binding protein n=1 Tax=Amycolatopsis saalfeldensis TaxID=394193 RepID=A0A1H8YIE7_9PSEU|nr:AraC family transcriptional regulator [Amycolatopsis saalfeldensis]SEP51791.1 AraC-type DNA-binding protein [Amycolatopsis saalfeldensis]
MTVSAWRPQVPGIAEVFHARFVGHAYPVHTHDTWTLLIVDDGAIRYDLDRHHHGALGTAVTLLPPNVAHDGRAATSHGFRKRVLYLDADVLGEDLIGAAVDRPSLADGLLRTRVHQLHQTLANPEPLEAESRLVLVSERLRAHLGAPAPTGATKGLAEDLRDLLDERLPGTLTLAEAADSLGAHPVHLVRSFGRRFGLPPHRYVTGRRVDHARRLLLDGTPPADVAAAAGFTDQAHLTRHFKRYLGTTPGRFSRR